MKFSKKAIIFMIILLLILTALVYYLNKNAFSNSPRVYQCGDCGWGECSFKDFGYPCTDYNGNPGRCRQVVNGWCPGGPAVAGWACGCESVSGGSKQEG